MGWGGIGVGFGGGDPNDAIHNVQFIKVHHKHFPSLLFPTLTLPSTSTLQETTVGTTSFSADIGRSMLQPPNAAILALPSRCSLSGSFFIHLFTPEPVRSPLVFFPSSFYKQLDILTHQTGHTPFLSRLAVPKTARPSGNYHCRSIIGSSDLLCACLFPIF